MRKLWHFFCYFIHVRKIWRWPRRADVLIFDVGRNPGFDQGFEELLRPYASESLPLLILEVNVPVLLASLFTRESRSKAYYDRYIARVAPRLVITYVDNNIGFYFLAARHKNIRTLFVQNGPRGSEVFEELDSMPATSQPRVDQMLVVASRYIPLYTKRFQGAVVPMGSLRNNLVPKRHARKAGTIAFISQYRNTDGFMWGGKFRTRQEFFEQADQLALSFLLDYSRKHGKELFIIPSTGSYQDGTLEKEQAYYNQLMGQSFTFSKWSWHGSSYDAVDTAEVVVGIDSALGYESAARGNKTAIFSMRSKLLQMTDRVYGWPVPHPDDGPFWTNRPDPAAFERILDHLFAISDVQWQAELAEHQFGNIMAYDPGNAILQSVLQGELGAPPPVAAHK